jgi:uncharacterized protein (DUF433 family)
MAPEEISAEYEVPRAQVQQALAFYEAHRAEIDAAVAAETQMEINRA